MAFGFVSSWAQDNQAQNLILNVPSGLDYPREALNLTIQLPNKIQPSPEAKKLSRTVIRKRPSFDSEPIKKISPKSRFRRIMGKFARKGLITSKTDKIAMANPRITRVRAARIVIRAFDAVLFFDERNELKRLGIRKADILDLKELIDEFQKKIKMFTFNPTQMHTELDRIMEKVNKTQGKGIIRITGLQESDDGTTINLFITKQ